MKNEFFWVNVRKNYDFFTFFERKGLHPDVGADNIEEDM